MSLNNGGQNDPEVAQVISHGSACPWSFHQLLFPVSWLILPQYSYRLQYGYWSLKVYWYMNKYKESDSWGTDFYTSQDPCKTESLTLSVWFFWLANYQYCSCTYRYICYYPLLKSWMSINILLFCKHIVGYFYRYVHCHTPQSTSDIQGRPGTMFSDSTKTGTNKRTIV